MNFNDLIRASYMPKKSDKGVVTKSYRKGRYARVQQIFDKNGFVIKQIIHKMH